MGFTIDLNSNKHSQGVPAMNLQSGKLFLSAVLSSVCAVSAIPVEAGCHGRSGGYSHSASYSSRVSYHQPVYSTPIYSQPAYPQPQPMYGQTQPMPRYNPAQQGFPMTQGMQPQQNFPVQQSLPTQQGFAATGQTAQAGAMPMTQPGHIANGPATGPAMVNGQSPIGSPGSAVPGASANQPGAIQAPSNVPGSNPSFNDAQQSALQALGGFAPPQETTPASPEPVQQTVQTQQPSFTGTWTASLANGARVQLALQADGSFSWTAINKDGQSSVFQGIYNVENGSLSLTRNNDGQKLSGSVTTTGTNAFSFQLSVAQSSSLDFVRG